MKINEHSDKGVNYYFIDIMLLYVCISVNKRLYYDVALFI